MKKITLPIKGMTCASCAMTIEKVISKLDGVSAVNVNFATEKASVEYEPEKISISRINDAIKKYGYEILESFQISGLKKTGGQESGSCKILPEEQADESCTSPVSGKKTSDKPQITYNAQGINNTQNTGKQARLADLEDKKIKVYFVMPIAIMVFVLMMWEIAATANKQIPYFFLPHELYSIILFILASVVLFWIGRPFLKGIVNFIRYRAANMDTLVGIGTLSAYLYSTLIVLFPNIRDSLGLPVMNYFDVTIVVIGFVYMGKYLEASSKIRTGEAIEKLINLAAKTAVVLRENTEVEIPVEQVEINDIVVVKPGGKIPVDGTIIEGFSSIDESMVTGESIPVDKKEGSAVIGGTINKQGSFKFKATRIGSDTMLARIINMVEEAQGSKAPIQRLADKISGIFVPIVMGIAFAALATWLIAGRIYMPLNEAFRYGLLSFVGVLVIACPCALGLATPTAIIVGVGKGAQYGILIKNAESLEKLHRVNTIVVDKTGTITKGEPSVTDFLLNADDIDEKTALKVIASLENNSEHPLAQSIVKKAKSLAEGLIEVTGFLNLEGMGIKGDIEGSTYYAGNPGLMDSLGIKYDRNPVTEITGQGKTPVLFADNKRVIATIAIADTLKESSIKAVSELHKLGIKVIMISGDNKNTAEYIARQVGIDQVYAEVLPKDKAVKVRELQQSGLSVAMAGDGINDAPALVQADVGIAMGTGTDVAIESADITLLAGDIIKIPQAVKLSRKTMSTIRQNLFWAFVYNMIGIPVAAGLLYPFWGILLNPVFAGLAMAFSSVSVVVNSLRLRFAKL